MHQWIYELPSFNSYYLIPFVRADKVNSVIIHLDMLPYLKEIGQTNPGETNFLTAKTKKKYTFCCMQILKDYSTGAIIIFCVIFIIFFLQGNI